MDETEMDLEHEEELVAKVPFKKRPTTDEEVARAKEFAMLAVAEKSVSKSALFNQGFNSGFAAAADDYLSEKIKLEIFTTVKTQEDVCDMYELGFDAGYMRKLAELLVF